MSRYEDVVFQLRQTPKVWLITGVAGFIGSNLLEALLKLDQSVVGLDNFATGHRKNLNEVEKVVTETQWKRFRFIEGDICDYGTCESAVKKVDFVLHQAALGSVPRSIANPIDSNAVNITGFLNMIQAAKEESVSSFTYAASSSTYGDHPELPKVEENIGDPLSPYAVTKYVNELYAGVFGKVYKFNTIGLRYFNVFGKRQDPNSAYSAVIPKWTSAMINGEDVSINGDGKTSRDFCYIKNVIQINILAATAPDGAKNEVYNVAVGGQTSLNDLYLAIKGSLHSQNVDVSSSLRYRDFRDGDVRHSLADISKAKTLLGYEPKYTIDKGLTESTIWYVNYLNSE